MFSLMFVKKVRETGAYEYVVYSYSGTSHVLPVSPYHSSHPLLSLIPVPLLFARISPLRFCSRGGAGLRTGSSLTSFPAIPQSRCSADVCQRTADLLWNCGLWPKIRSSNRSQTKALGPAASWLYPPKTASRNFDFGCPCSWQI